MLHFFEMYHSDGVAGDQYRNTKHHEIGDISQDIGYHHHPHS